MSLKKPLVSVIIPTYNRSAFLPGAIQSVLNQKNAPCDIEVIVVDDGSTDDTAEVVKKFGSKVKYARVPHSGKPSVPRNTGLELAAGDLIAFQDSDDMWADDKLAKQVPVFDDQAVTFSYGNARIMENDGSLTSAYVVPPNELQKGEDFKTLIKGNVISTLTVMVRREVIEAVGGFNESNDLRAVEDYELWLRIVANNPKSIKSIPHALAHYRMHEDNISKSSALQAEQRLIAVFDSLWLTDLNEKQRALVEARLGELHEGWGRLSNEATPHNIPVISVVMSVYNAGDYLVPAISGILDQTYTNFEFIIIDDGSKDDSAQTVRSFDDPRIRLIHQTNHGLVYSLNKGVNLARGRYIARQDADDISLPSRFDKLLQAITANPRLGLVGSFFTYIDEQTSVPSVTITSATKHLDLRRSFYIVNPFGHGSTLIRKDAIINAGGYTDDYGPTEDFELWRRIAEEWEIGQVPESLYWYRINPNSISHQKQEIQHKFTAKIIAEQWRRPFLYKGFRTIVRDGYYYRSLQNPFAETIYHQYINEQYVIAMELFARGKFKTGLITAMATCKLDPSKRRAFIRPAIGGFLRKLGLKEKKK